jgi:hypothetical protein
MQTPKDFYGEKEKQLCYILIIIKAILSWSRNYHVNLGNKVTKFV